MALIQTTLGDLDEAVLQKRDTVLDTDDEHTAMVEYCLADCDGAAHRTGVPDAPSHFCAHHVHRSVHVTKTRWPDGLGSILGSFT